MQECPQWRIGQVAAMPLHPTLRPPPQCQQLAVAKSFTPAQLARCVGEAFADSDFANLARCQFGLTPYKIAAEPKLRIPPYIMFRSDSIKL